MQSLTLRSTWGRLQSSCADLAEFHACKQWQQELWGRSQRLLVLLAKLSAESALPTVRLAAALSLPEPAVRAKYDPPSPSLQESKLKAALASGLLRDHGGWAAVRHRSKMGAREAIARRH